MTRREFWLKPNKWPGDATGWVFLGRAVHDIGKARFPNEWTGTEPQVWEASSPNELVRFPASPIRATSSEKRHADQVLRALRPDLAASRPPIPRELARDFRLNQPRPDIAFTSHEWELARTEVERAREINRQCIVRFKAVIDTLAGEAEARRLVTGVRPMDGGSVTPMPAEWWNTEKLRTRLTMCQIAPSDPFGLGSGFARSGYRNRNDYGAPEYGWIFIGAESLDRFIKSLDSKATSNSGARKKAAIEFLKPLLSKPRPADMNKSIVQQRCMDATSVGVRGFLAAWESVEKHPDWAKSGRPKSSQ